MTIIITFVEAATVDNAYSHCILYSNEQNRLTVKSESVINDAFDKEVADT